MHVGIANPFAYRPHVAHMAFIDRQLKRLGHRTFFLGCAGEIDNCASRASKSGLRKRLECVKCRAGSIRSYLDVEPARLDLAASVTEQELRLGAEWAYSTACTTLQIEHEAQTRDADFCAMQQSLSEPTARAYTNARRWIRDNRLECVFLFNGRFELTRAIVEACVSESIRFVSVERSWFGDGLQLLPNEGCLGLKTFLDFGTHWSDKPLTRAQAERASGVIGRRLSRQSHGEWLQYNLEHRPVGGRGEIRYLFLPSSQHEWLGDPDRSSGWEHPVAALEYLFARLGIGMDQLVVRAHPGWALNIKNYGVNRANGFYREWCRRVGAEYIEPQAQVDTHSLIRLAQIVFVNSSSAALEASWRGTPVVSLVPSAYTSSGICINLFSAADVDALDAHVVGVLGQRRWTRAERLAQCQRALRFLYCANYRLMQFVDSVKAINPFAFHSIDPVDLSGLQALVERGVLLPEDPEHAVDDSDEREVAMAIIDGKGDTLGVDAVASGGAGFAPIRRRSAYRLIDLVSV